MSRKPGIPAKICFNLFSARMERLLAAVGSRPRTSAVSTQLRSSVARPGTAQQVVGLTRVAGHDHEKAVRIPSPSGDGGMAASVDRGNGFCSTDRMKLTLQLQLLPTADQAAELLDTMERFNAAASFAAKVGFEQWVRDPKDRSLTFHLRAARRQLESVISAGRRKQPAQADLSTTCATLK